MKTLRGRLFDMCLTKTNVINYLRVLLFASLLPSISYASVMVHTVNEGNVSGHMTRLDNTAINGNPDKLLFVTPRFGTYNPHTVGVWYEEETAQWTIYNEDKVALPLNAQFNVIALDSQVAQAFTHTATDEDTTEYYTIISHPACDYNPNATLLITPNWSEAYVPGPLGVWYDGNNWSIYRQDKEPLSPGTRFNVLVLNEGPNSLVGLEAFDVTSLTHRSDESNTRGHITTMSRRNPGEFILITHNWKDKGPYNFDVPGVWYNGENWTILNQKRKKIEIDALFNSIIFTPTARKSASPVDNQISVGKDAETGWIQIQNKGNFEIEFLLVYSLGGQSHTVSSGVLAFGASETFQLPMGAKDLVLVGEAKQNEVYKVIVNQEFPSVPNQAFVVSSSLMDPQWSIAKAVKF